MTANLFTTSGDSRPCLYRIQPFRQSHAESGRAAGMRRLVGAGSGKRVVAEALPVRACRMGLAFADLRPPPADARG